jgi:hypothetical protein
MSIPDHSIEHDANGGMTLRLADGGIFSVDENGCANGSVPHAISVGVLDLAEIESHAINTIAGSRSHVVRFRNGGLLQYAYNDAGQLITLSSDKLNSQLSRGSQKIVYWMADGPGADVYIVE